MSTKLEDIENEQKATQILMQQLAQAEDAEERDALLAMVIAQGAKLEETAVAFGEQEEARLTEEYPDALNPNVPRVAVLLTDEQRKRVFEETGIDVHTVYIDDMSGRQMQGMPEAHPDEIEAIAMEKAISVRQQIEAAEANQQVADDALAELEESDNEALLEQVAELKKDPNFAGGAIYDPDDPE